MTRKAKGIWIPMEIWENTEISWAEKALLVEVASFIASGDRCFLSNAELCKRLGSEDRPIDPRTVQRYIANLVRRGYLKESKFDGRRRYLETVKDLQFCRGRHDKNAENNPANLSWQTRQECRGRGDKNVAIIKSVNNIDLIEKKNTKKRETEKVRFIRPSVDEVRDYCDKRNNTIDAEEFVAYYESCGWVTGSTCKPMKDWKAAVRYWESKRKKEQPTAKAAAPRHKDAPVSVYEHNLRELGKVTGHIYGNTTDNYRRD